MNSIKDMIIFPEELMPRYGKSGELTRYNACKSDGLARQIYNFRNFVNNRATDTRIDPKIHQGSKYVVLGALYSVLGSIESLALCIENIGFVILRAPFSLFMETGIQSNWKDLKNSSALLGYYLVNVCTLGTLGYVISDESIDQILNDNKKVLVGNRYGQQDVEYLSKEASIYWV